MKSSNRLTTLQLPALLKQPGRHRDGDGLILLVRDNGSAFWVLRYMLNGKSRELGLGPLRLVNLAEARARAREARQALLDKRDPVALKQAAATAAKLEQLRAKTFAQAAEEFMQTDAVQKLGNDEHRRQWRTTMEEACKTIGDIPLGEIDTPLVLKVLLPVWERAPETASRLRGRIERVLAWSIVHQFRAGPNPASRDLLRDALPSKPRAKHHAAMPYAELPAFMVELRKRDSIRARALEFCILTATRTSEVTGARWAEIDLDAKVWTMPAARMKAKRDHRVPLSERAVELLRQSAEKNAAESREHVFANDAGRPLARGTLSELLSNMGQVCTVHGFRSSFSDWARDRTGYPRDVIEMALAHAIKDKSEAAYRRGDALDKRRRLMNQWATYCAGHAVTTDTVVPLRA